MKKRLDPIINYKKSPITTTYIQNSSPILKLKTNNKSKFFNESKTFITNNALIEEPTTK